MPTTTPAIALSELRSATHALHADLERSLAIAHPGAGRNDYLAYISAFWGWLSPFEEKLWKASWPERVGADERAGKRFWMESDLRAAGFDDHALGRIPVSGFMPNLDTAPARIGLAYVLEGAQLGTQVLRKRLAPSLGDWSPRWLQGYGARTGSNWQAFLECVEQCLDTGQARREAAASACRAFENLASWFRRQGVA